MHFGLTLKKIRKNRCMTQAELTKGIIKQGTYSRIESGQLQVSAETLFLLVERLNVTMNEFIYIHNNYNSSTRQKLINSFSRMELMIPKEMKEQLTKIQAYLKHQHDQDLLMILYSYQAIIVLTEQDDLEKVRDIASNVWQHMQQLDHWYFNDLDLLNAIIPYFPLGIAREITSTALKRLDAYDNFEKDVTYLKLYFQLNLTTLYLEAGEFEECLNQLNNISQAYKRKLTYQTLGFIYTRKVTCKHFLQQPYNTEINNLKDLMRLFDDPEVFSLFISELNANKIAF